MSWILLAAAAAAAYAWTRIFAGHPRPPAPLACLAPRELAFLEAAAEALFPPGGAIPPSGREAGAALHTDRWLAGLPPSTRLLVRLLLFLMEHATVFFPAPGGVGGMRRFSALDPERRVAVLEGWQGSRLFPRRLVFTSLRAIVTMGYFSSPAVLRALDLAPRAIRSPVCEADLLYPRIGARPETITLTRADVGPPSDGTPLSAQTPLHPAYAAPAGAGR